MGLSEYYLSQDPTLLNQTFMFNSTQGLYPVTLADLDLYLNEQVTYAIIFGVRIGTAAIVSILLTLMTRKYKSPVFWLNQTSLVLLIIHSSLFLSFLLGPFNTISLNFSGSSANVTFGDLETSLATNCVQFLLIVSIEASLLFQIRSSFSDYSKYKNIFTAIIFCVSTLPTIIVWIITLIYVSIETVDPFSRSKILTTDKWAVDAMWPIFTASVMFYTAIFSIKLFLAIRRRRKLGLKQLDTTQIIFIVSVQTMIVPSIFTIIQWAVPGVPPGYSAFTPLVVVISLPLSAMWASFNITTPHLSSNKIVLYSEDSASEYTEKRSLQKDPETHITETRSPTSPSTMNHPARSPSDARFVDDDDMYSYNEIIRIANKEAANKRYT